MSGTRRGSQKLRKAQTLITSGLAWSRLDSLWSGGNQELRGEWRTVIAVAAGPQSAQAAHDPTTQKEHLMCRGVPLVQNSGALGSRKSYSQELGLTRLLCIMNLRYLKYYTNRYL